MLTRIRRMVYEMGFRPKLYSVFFSPSLNLRYAFEDTYKNGKVYSGVRVLDWEPNKMSICLVAPINPNHTIFTGWDYKLNTHYVRILDPTIVGQNKSSVVLWIGTTEGEIPHIATIAEALRPYALFDKNGLVIDQYL